ncbi:MAG TPA: helix-turn-helix domain-containing protein [Thauera sp.]|nr:helix-turn-helix domain-containing protein [Thauera sp.]
MTDPTPQYAEVFNGADLPAALIAARTGAELLDISERQWHRLVQRGLLPKPIRLGRNTRWKLAEVEAALEAIVPGDI